MIAANQAKPWLTIEGSQYRNGIDGEKDAEQMAQLLRALLERGFPVAVTRTDPQETPANSLRIKSPTFLVEGAETPVDQLVEEIESRTQEQLGEVTTRKWKPWFPVIDMDRCTNCMQCLSFCLFDVYSVTEDKKITVQNEDNCKTDCPACSRVCPEVAIMFPKYKAAPINGDEVSSDDTRREAMKVDISSLLGGDIYALLRDRSAKAKSRFSAERDDDRALRERQRCLKKLQTMMEDLDIPPEVLSSLPSDEMIRAKAAAAQQKAANTPDQ
ncbi:pyruvate flavodoxin oxidoreductase subunit delta [Novipirellula aureliae]|uniref:Pyruvate flavodoxin oxidoreductase subunit delta n=1 Tax=Novipirellula aureliae TaxID=2527966 RepID=A0A5C6E8I4_9BACT|nr:ferredoxin family protein [Novipirellula aureliae]TWU45983.1 pyruvate flavodoxin oxidoreductase subunit delta [Novipirellula aureliae]